MNDSPARILKQWLIDNGYGVDPETDPVSDWPIYVGQMPDTRSVKDRAIAIYDPAGTSEGRIQRTGETVIHPGLQIRVRDREYEDGYRKTSEISVALDDMLWEYTLVNSTDYVIQAVHKTPIIPLGPEPEGRRRTEFIINAIATITATDLTEDLAGQYDASQANTIILSGSSVTDWNEAGGSGRDLPQAVAGSQPSYSLGAQNGLNVVDFDKTPPIDHVFSDEPDYNLNDFSLHVVYKRIVSEGPILNFGLLAVQYDGNASALSGALLRVESNDTINAVLAASPTVVHKISSPIDTVPIDRWFVVSLGKVGAVTTLYVNGVEIAKREDAPLALNYSGTLRTGIGCDFSSGFQIFGLSGSVGEARIYCGARWPVMVAKQLLYKWGVAA